MDSRTRVKNTIDRRPTDRIPRYDNLWEDTVARWKTGGYPTDVDPIEFFDWDIVTMGIDLSMRLEHRLISRNDEYEVVQDRYGYTVKRVLGKSRTMECLDHVTKNKEAWNDLRQRFEFDPTDTSRIDDKGSFLRMDEYPTWEETKSRYERLRRKDRYLVFAGYGPWEGTWRHRGYSQLLMDIAADPDWAADMGGALIELLIATLKHSMQIGMTPDALFLADDPGTTRALLFSPQSWRAIFKPLYMKLGTFLEDNDVSFWLHCCGSCEALFEDLIDCRLKVIQPLQAHAGLDVRELKPKYGDRLTFWGNIDARKMSGPPDALEEEIRDKISFAKQGGGYMYHSDHSIPPEVSFQRYLWIMELVEKYGTYN